MKSSWFSSSERYEFAKTLREVDYGMTMYELFRIFLECSFYSLHQISLVASLKGKDSGLEQAYLNSVVKVKDPSKLGAALGLLTLGLEKKREDFLGLFSSEIGANDSKWRGQCFTPDSLSTLVSKLVCPDLPEKGEGATLWIDEPSCGGGSMVIGMSNELMEKGFKPRQFHFVCTDVDIKCVHMTYIQTTLLCIPAYVVHGNTLSLEVSGTYRNFPSVINPPYGPPESKKLRNKLHQVDIGF